VLYFPKPALAWGLTAHNASNEPTPFSTRKTIGSASGPVNRITQQAINLRLHSYTFGLFAEHLLRDLIVYPFRQGYQMPHPDFAIVYSGASFQADLLKSLLEGKGIRAILEDEFLGRIVPMPFLAA